MAFPVGLWPCVMPVHSPTAIMGTARPTLWCSDFPVLVICYGACGFAYTDLAAFLPAMARKVVEDPLLFGWAWPVFGAAAAVSTIFAARLKQAVSHRAVWIGGHLVMALGIVVPLVVPGLSGIMTAALLVGGTFMVVTMAGMGEARRVAAPRARA